MLPTLTPYDAARHRRSYYLLEKELRPRAGSPFCNPLAYAGGNRISLPPAWGQGQRGNLHLAPERGRKFACHQRELMRLWPFEFLKPPEGATVFSSAG